MYIKIVQVQPLIYGNQVQIKDNKTSTYYRYCHLLYGSITVNVGDKVNLGSKLR